MLRQGQSFSVSTFVDFCPADALTMVLSQSLSGHVSLLESSALPQESATCTRSSSSRVAKAKPGAKNARSKVKGRQSKKAKKANFKANSAVRRRADASSQSAKRPARRTSLKARLVEETKNCRLSDLLRLTIEAEAEIADIDAALQKDSDLERELLSKIDGAQALLRGVAARTEAAMRLEMSSLERLKASEISRAEASKATEDAQGSHDDVARNIAILELEMQSRHKVAEGEAAKLAAKEAVRQAHAEWKAKEKQAAKAAKVTSHGQDLTVATLLKEKKAIAEDSLKEASVIQRETLRREMAEVKDFQRMRAEREKARQHGLKQTLNAKRLHPPLPMPMQELPASSLKMAMVRDAD